MSWFNNELNSIGVGRYDPTTNSFTTPDGRQISVDEASAMANTAQAAYSPQRQQALAGLTNATRNIDLYEQPQQARMPMPFSGGGGGGGFSSVGSTPASQNAPPGFSSADLGGGFGARDGVSFPMRYGAPASQVVNDPLAGFGSMQDWESNWQGRYNNTPQTLTSGGGSSMQWTTADAARSGSDPSFLDTVSSGQDFRWDGNNIQIGRMVSSPSSSSPNPAYQALMDEKDRMQPLFQQRERSQQAYDNMGGQNSPFGLLPADYTAPGSGQVSGEVNPFAPEIGAGRAAVQGATDGISTDWLTGTYDPTTMQSTGVYDPGQGGLGGLGGIRGRQW